MLCLLPMAATVLVGDAEGLASGGQTGRHTLDVKSNLSLSGATREPRWSASPRTLRRAKFRAWVPVWLFMTSLRRSCSNQDKRGWLSVRYQDKVMDEGAERCIERCWQSGSTTMQGIRSKWRRQANTQQYSSPQATPCMPLRVKPTYQLCPYPPHSPAPLPFNQTPPHPTQPNSTHITH